MEFDSETVISEIKNAFYAYETALNDNDVEALTGFFWEDPRAVRLSPKGSLYGFDAIASFRKGRDVSDIKRDLLRVDFIAIGPDLGVANCEYERLESKTRGCQSQVWVRVEAGWRIVSAHVS